MVIDCHGHYTTVPDAFDLERTNLIASFEAELASQDLRRAGSRLGGGSPAHGRRFSSICGQRDPRPVREVVEVGIGLLRCGDQRFDLRPELSVTVTRLVQKVGPIPGVEVHRLGKKILDDFPAAGVDSPVSRTHPPEFRDIATL